MVHVDVMSGPHDIDIDGPHGRDRLSTWRLCVVHMDVIGGPHESDIDGQHDGENLST